MFQSELSITHSEIEEDKDETLILLHQEEEDEVKSNENGSS